MAYRNALAALADPTRRRVFERLKSGPEPVRKIARGLPVSRPAVSQHLKVLKEAGLVTDRPEGTRRVYYIDPEGRCAPGSTGSGTRRSRRSKRKWRPKPEIGRRRNDDDYQHDHDRAGAQEPPRQRRPGARVRSLHLRARPLVAAQGFDRLGAPEAKRAGAAAGRAMVPDRRGRLPRRRRQNFGVGAAAPLRDELGHQQQLEAGRERELRGRGAVPARRG